MKKITNFRFILSNDIFAVCLATVYLLVYCTLLQFENTRDYGVIMLLFSPILVVWMVYTVLKYGKYKGPALGDDEFGYLDKGKNEPGVF